MIFLFLFLINIFYSFGLSWLSFTDSHIDLDYKANSPDNCLLWSNIGTKCCRQSSIPLKPYNKVSKWGNIKCDIPTLLFEGIINWIKTNLYSSYKFDFIINTGDDCSHKDISQPFSSINIKTINYVWNVINNNFPTIPYYPVYGNHDEVIVDQTPPLLTPQFISKSSYNWNKWIANSSTLQYGYYSQVFNKNLKIISFNSIYYDSNNIFKINNTKNDIKRINNQFKWLDNELNNSLINNQQVLFLNHIPIGGSESIEYSNYNLKLLLEKYQSIILLNMNGHTHNNRFTLIKNTNNKYIGFSMIPLSMTTDNHFPGFRIYTYNNNKLDYTNYICNLTEIILNNKILCQYEYTFSTEYNISNINLNNTIQLYNNLINSPNYFNKYYSHYSTGGNISDCTTNSCKKNYINEIIV